MTVTAATGAFSIGGYAVSASGRSGPPSDRLAPTQSPSGGSGRPEASVWISCSFLASAICDRCWLSMSATSAAGGHTGRLVSARPVRRRSLSNAISVARSLCRRCSAGCITSTIWPHDHRDKDFAPYGMVHDTLAAQYVRARDEQRNCGERPRSREAFSGLAAGAHSGWSIARLH